MMDDIAQGLSQVHSDSKDLQQLQLDKNKIQVITCGIVLLYY